MEDRSWRRRAELKSPGLNLHADQHAGQPQALQVTTLPFAQVYVAPWKHCAPEASLVVQAPLDVGQEDTKHCVSGFAVHWPLTQGPGLSPRPPPHPNSAIPSVPRSTKKALFMFMRRDPFFLCSFVPPEADFARHSAWLPTASAAGYDLAICAFVRLAFEALRPRRQLGCASAT